MAKEPKEKKKGPLGRIMEKLDRKLKKKAKEKGCCECCCGEER